MHNHAKNDVHCCWCMGIVTRYDSFAALLYIVACVCCALLHMHTLRSSSVGCLPSFSLYQAPSLLLFGVFVALCTLCCMSCLARLAQLPLTRCEQGSAAVRGTVGAWCAVVVVLVCVDL